MLCFLGLYLFGFREGGMLNIGLMLNIGWFYIKNRGSGVYEVVVNVVSVTGFVF